GMIDIREAVEFHANVRIARQLLKRRGELRQADERGRPQQSQRVTILAWLVLNLYREPGEGVEQLAGGKHDADDDADEQVFDHDRHHGRQIDGDFAPAELQQLLDLLEIHQLVAGV